MKKLAQALLLAAAWWGSCGATPVTATVYNTNQIEGKDGAKVLQYWDDTAKIWVTVTPSTPLPVLSAASAADYAMTQTVVSCASTTTPLFAATPGLKYLMFQNTGANDVTLSVGATAVLYAGVILQATGANKQGSSQEFTHGAPSTAFSCITPSGSSNVTVWTGS